MLGVSPIWRLNEMGGRGGDLLARTIQLAYSKMPRDLNVLRNGIDQALAGFDRQTRIIAGMVSNNRYADLEEMVPGILEKLNEGQLPEVSRAMRAMDAVKDDLGDYITSTVGEFGLPHRREFPALRS